MTNKEKQAILVVCGADIAVDGLWGSQSSTAVRDLQRDAGITIDGVFGHDTEQVARSYVAEGKQMPKKNVAAGQDTNVPTNATDIIVGGNGMVSKYFSDAELKCKCGGQYCNGHPAEYSQKLLTLADRVREHFDRPMIPTSTLRCERWNSHCGGVATSRHQYGRAMDFYIPGVPADTILEYVQQQPETAYSYHIQNSTCVHMDVL